MPSSFQQVHSLIQDSSIEYSNLEAINPEPSTSSVDNTVYELNDCNNLSRDIFSSDDSDYVISSSGANYIFL